MDIILGSGSPRRKEILGYFSLPFRQIASHFDEESIAYTGDPAAYAKELALKKGETLYKAHPSSIIISADTVVAIDGEHLAKPVDEHDTIRMLQKLAGRWHSVFTAVSVYATGVHAAEVEETKVLCNSPTQDELYRYMRKLSLHDKAGAYAMQKCGSIFINRVEGCPYNVIGLPINALRKLLQQVGIDLWDYLQDLE